jgi:hypothetical protein
MQRLFPILALLLISSSGFAQAPGRVMPDNRMVIQVTKSERNQVLVEMREFLHGLHNIQHAIGRKDMKSLAVTARPMGPLLDRTPASLKEKLPEEFTQLAIAQNEAFLSLAKMAENKADVGDLLEQTAEIITYCSGCHDAYRFEIITPSKSRK